jgi:hypothetical protein
MPYTVETYTICEGWVNCWSVWLDDDTSEPETFETEAEAEAAINAFFAEVAKEGPEFSEGYRREDYRVVELVATRPSEDG